MARPDLAIETTRTIGDQSREDWAARARGLDADTRGRKWSLEVERGVAEGRFDIAVHSGKDLPNQPFAGTMYLPVLEREDPRDAFIPRQPEAALQDLPKGAVIGTNSARRRAALRDFRADLRFADYAGNVPTRIAPERMAEKGVDGAIIAAAGLKRLRLFEPARMQLIDPEISPPSATQGIIAAQIRVDAAPALRAAVEALQHPPTVCAWEAERAFLGVFEVWLRNADCGLCAGELRRRRAEGHGDRRLRAAKAGRGDAVRQFDRDSSGRAWRGNAGEGAAVRRGFGEASHCSGGA